MRLKKFISSCLKRFLRSRKIIIVSDRSVDYYPLSRFSQISLILSTIGFISWASYSTGSYMAAESQIEQKNQTIETVNQENRKIEGEFAILRQDLMRLQQDDGEKSLSEYTRFVIEQYENDDMAGVKDLAYGGIVSSNDQGMLFERMSFLEKRVKQLKGEKEQFVDAIQDRVNGRVKMLEKVIKATGLKTRTLERKQASINRRKYGSVKSAKSALSKDKNAQGGPFIPVESSEMLKKKQNTLKAIDRWIVLNDIVKKLPISRPIGKARTTSGFGHRSDPFNRRLARHTGQDFAGPVGSKIFATSAGKVIYASRKGAYGKVVEISHGFGIVTRYAHLSSIRVKVGQWVGQGRTIGIQGTTGRSTGHHLHYEVRYHNTPLNPKRFLRAGRQYVRN